MPEKQVKEAVEENEGPCFKS